MLPRLFLLFTAVPLTELYLLIKIGGAIGALNTILLLLATGLFGAALARLQGLRTLRQIFYNLSQGILPTEELIDGFLIFSAGVLLITPGVLTDLAGILLLLPHTRALFKRWLRRKLNRMVASGDLRVYYRRGIWGNP